MTENKKEKNRALSADDEDDDDDDDDAKLPPDLIKALDFAWKSEKSPVSYTSMEKLYRQLKSRYKDLKRYHVERYLLNDDIFTRFSEKKQKQTYRKIVTYKTFELLTSDLLTISNLSKWNDKINYLCIIYDTFSHYLIVVCLRDKTSASMKEAFKAALDQPIVNKANLHLLLTDLGRKKKERQTGR